MNPRNCKPARIGDLDLCQDNLTTAFAQFSLEAENEVLATNTGRGYSNPTVMKPHTTPPLPREWHGQGASLWGRVAKCLKAGSVPPLRLLHSVEGFWADEEHSFGAWRKEVETTPVNDLSASLKAAQQQQHHWERSSRQASKESYF